MTQSVTLSEAAYQSLQKIAAREGRTPESVIERLIAAASQNDGPNYETEDWFRHLGMTEDEIREARERAEREDVAH